MNKAFDVITAIVWVALIFTLVRPRSQGPQLVTAISNGFSGALKAATGGGSF